jgi:Flp pilus assembly protein TadD
MVTGSASNTRSPRWLLPLLLGALAYANALWGGFHFDDAHAIVENPAIRSLGNLGHFFSDATTFSVLPQNQSYRPLLLVTYALTSALAGVRASAFLAVNLAVHLACVALFLALLRRVARLFGRAEDHRLLLLAASIFAVHPLFSECIDYVSARSESLCAAFTLAAAVLYLRAREERRTGPLALAAAAMACATLVKTVTCTLPLVLLAFEVAAAERDRPRRVAGRIAWILAPALGGLVLVAKLTPALAIRSASTFTPLEYFRSELPAILHYLALFIWPVGQSADPAYPAAASFSEPRVVLAALALLGALAFAAQALIRRRRVALALSVIWFLAFILPSSSFFPLAELVNEHRPYLAALAFCPWLAAALLHGAGRLLALDGPAARRVGLVTAAFALVLLGSLTVARNRVWRSDEALWADVVAQAPGSARAQMNYGLALMAQGRLADAEPRLREAVRLAPFYPYAYLNLAQLALAQGHQQEGRTLLDRAVALGPGLVYAHYYRGLAAETLGETPAIRLRFFARAAELAPTHPDAQYHLALALDATGDLPGAERAARQAVQLRGSYDDRFLLAFVLLERRDARAAEPMLAALRRERPADAKVEQNYRYAERLLAGARQ